MMRQAFQVGRRTTLVRGNFLQSRRQLGTLGVADQTFVQNVQEYVKLFSDTTLHIDEQSNSDVQLTLNLGKQFLIKTTVQTSNGGMLGLLSLNKGKKYKPLGIQFIELRNSLEQRENTLLANSLLVAAQPNSLAREVIIPQKLFDASVNVANLEYHGLSLSNIPNLYNLFELKSMNQAKTDKNVRIRSAPVSRPIIIFYHPEYDTVRSKLMSSNNSQYEILTGGHFYSTGHDREIREEQLSNIDFNRIFGVELRISNAPISTTSYYLEGSDSVLAGTIAEVQSNRVFGGDSSVLETKFGYSGDCWSEARAMAKSMVQRVVSDSTQKVLSVFQTKKECSNEIEDKASSRIIQTQYQRVSREPSIHE